MDRTARPFAAKSPFGKCTQAGCHIFRAALSRVACAGAPGPKRWQAQIGTLMPHRQLRAGKKFCADVIEDGFDLTNNKFSYSSLKELVAKVLEFLGFALLYRNRGIPMGTMRPDKYGERSVSVQ